MTENRAYDLAPLQRLLSLLDEDTRVSLKSVPRLIHWFDHEPLATFGGLTARQLMQGGREKTVHHRVNRPTVRLQQTIISLIFSTFIKKQR